MIVNLKAVCRCVELEDGTVEDIIDLFQFEDFHDAWEWIYKEHGNYTKLTNPTMNMEIQEIPTEDRAERLYRYAQAIMTMEELK